MVKKHDKIDYFMVNNFL